MEAMGQREERGVVRSGETEGGRKEENGKPERQRELGGRKKKD